LSVRARVVQFVRALFSSGPSEGIGDEPLDDAAGGLGVREPWKPLRPSSSGEAALEAPPDETRDVWAFGSDARG